MGFFFSFIFYTSKSLGQQKKKMWISEGINQLIAIDITKSMHNHGVFLFDNPKTAEEKGGTSYEEFAWLVAPMLEKYHDEVIASRIGSSMQPLLDIIGQEAFLKLNFLIKRFTELPYHKMLEDLRNNRNTELVAIRSDIINSAKEIYSKIASKKIWIFNFIYDIM